MTISFTENELMLIENCIWQYAESVEGIPSWREEYAKVRTVSDKIWKVVNKSKKQKENKKIKEMLNWADSVTNENNKEREKRK